MRNWTKIALFCLVLGQIQVVFAQNNEKEEALISKNVGLEPLRRESRYMYKLWIVIGMFVCPKMAQP